MSREGEERGRGIPRSQEERQRRHEEVYPGTPLPERGTGLSGSFEDLGPWNAGLLTLGLLALIITRKR